MKKVLNVSFQFIYLCLNIYLFIDIPVVEGVGDPIKIIEEADVLVLNTHNFHHIIGSKKLILVEFYAPWLVND